MADNEKIDSKQLNEYYEALADIISPDNNLLLELLKDTLYEYYQQHKTD